MMTHRQDGTTLPSYTIQSSFSVDGGFSFNNSSVVVYPGSDALRGRYPSGVIYNPAGNTTPTNAFAVAAGPMSNSGGWIGGFFASEKFDGTLNNVKTSLYTTDTAGGVGQLNQFPRYYMQARGNKVFLYGNDNADNGTDYTQIKTTVNIGTFNTSTNSYDWVRVGHTPDYLTDGADFLTDMLLRDLS